MKVLRLLCIMLVVAVAMALAAWVSDELKIDRCLDNGGRWNEEAATCTRLPLPMMDN